MLFIWAVVSRRMAITNMRFAEGEESCVESLRTRNEEMSQYRKSLFARVFLPFFMLLRRDASAFCEQYQPERQVMLAEVRECAENGFLVSSPVSLQENGVRYHEAPANTWDPLDEVLDEELAAAEAAHALGKRKYHHPVRIAGMICNYNDRLSERGFIAGVNHLYAPVLLSHVDHLTPIKVRRLINWKC